MNEKQVLWIILFLSSIFFSWQFFNGLGVFLTYVEEFDYMAMYFVWAIICLVIERIILKKLAKGKNIKTYFGLAIPFQTDQVLSILIGLLIHFYNRFWVN